MGAAPASAAPAFGWLCSIGNLRDEHASQNTCPQLRQWCLRRKREKPALQCVQARAFSSGCQITDMTRAAKSCGRDDSSEGACVCVCMYEAERRQNGRLPVALFASQEFSSQLSTLSLLPVYFVTLRPKCQPVRGGHQIVTFSVYFLTFFFPYKLPY